MTSINITFNSQQVQVQTGTSLREFVSTQIGKELDAESRAVDGSKLGVAAAVNGGVIPRSAWNATVLENGYSVELVTAAQGG